MEIRCTSPVLPQPFLRRPRTPRLQDYPGISPVKGDRLDSMDPGPNGRGDILGLGYPRTLVPSILE